MMDEELDRLKKCEVEILKEFMSVCETLNLRYYVAYGTLLGAVRHQGFIPWDDDIDVVMPRMDYEIFAKEGQKFLSAHLFVQTHETDSEYLNGYAKIRNSNTTFIESFMKDTKINHGVYIDIFPLDEYSGKGLYWFQLRKRLIEERIRMEIIPTDLVPLRGKLVRPIVKLMYPTADDVCRARDRLFCSEKGPLLACHFGEMEYVDPSWYGEGTKLSFEGLEVCAPKGYDKLLTFIYGDYMTLPPVEKRVAHHETELIDTENSYLTYMGK